MRRDIVIDVKTTRNGAEAWEHLDTYPDQSMTIQFISNLLSDIASVTSSSTLSVKLPRTVRNDRILDLATRPQYNSSMTHRKIECRVFINGIDMMREAFCYLLDSDGDSYEAAIVFGLMQGYGKWLTDSPGLRDLEDSGEFIRWDGKCATGCSGVWWSDYPSKYISELGPVSGHNLASQFYALYDCGVYRDSTALNLCNLHPCVTLREIYERIVKENLLNFVMPSNVLLDMEEIAIVQVERNQPDAGQQQQGVVTTSGANDVLASGPGIIQAKLGGLCGRIDLPDSDCHKTVSFVGKWLYQGEGAVTINFDLVLTPLSSGNRFGRLFDQLDSIYGTLDYVCLVFYDNTKGKILKFKPYSHSRNGNLVTARFKGSFTTGDPSSVTEGGTIAEMAVWLDPAIRDLDPAVSNILAYFFDLGGQAEGNRAFVADGIQQLDARYSQDIANGFTYTYAEGTTPYPNNFLLVPNLPDISQIDFIKSICQMYCIFPVASSQGEQIDFVPFDTLYDRTDFYDWSGKLLESYRDVPTKTSFRAGDHARRNVMRYQDDENEKRPLHSEASLDIDDDTLENEGVLFELPWAATRNNRISQYELQPESGNGQPGTPTYRAEFTQCRYRILRITEWQRQSDCANVAEFKDLDAEYILTTYYTAYQTAMRKPRVITEHIRLNELEMRDVDFKKPVYLGKYGRFYAIKQIQWTVGNEHAEVELLQL